MARVLFWNRISLHTQDTDLPKVPQAPLPAHQVIMLTWGSPVPTLYHTQDQAPGEILRLTQSAWALAPRFLHAPDGAICLASL